MKPIIFAIALMGVAAFTGAAYAGPGCSGEKAHDKTAEAPPPPPAPAPSS
jgi:hypothetical protein